MVQEPCLAVQSGDHVGAGALFQISMATCLTFNVAHNERIGSPSGLSEAHIRDPGASYKV